MAEITPSEPDPGHSGDREVTNVIRGQLAGPWQFLR